VLLQQDFENSFPGGSTGVPTQFYVSLQSCEWRTAVSDRRYSWAHAEPGRRAAQRQGGQCILRVVCDAPVPSEEDAMIVRLFREKAGRGIDVRIVRAPELEKNASGKTPILISRTAKRPKSSNETCAEPQQRIFD